MVLEKEKEILKERKKYEWKYFRRKKSKHIFKMKKNEDSRKRNIEAKKKKNEWKEEMKRKKEIQEIIKEKRKNIF